MNAANPLIRFVTIALAGALLTTLAACAENFDANVTRFQSQLPAPQGQSFAIVSDDPATAGGLEFAQYAKAVSAQLAKQGYSEAPSAGAASLIVHFSYGVDKGHEVRDQSRQFRDPYFSPWYGYQPYGFGGYYGAPYSGGYYRGGYGGGYGRGFAPHGLWGYGWYDPWFDRQDDNYILFNSGISLMIENRSDGKHLFEGKANAVSLSNRLTYLVPNLVEALFTGFPGNSGETVRISVAPEKKVNN
jgi:hypothetical protein